MSAAFPPAPSEAPAFLDTALVARCRAQDPAAYRAFVVRYERMVFALLSRMLDRSDPDVEDLAQETFVRAYRAFPSFDPSGPAKVSTWLLTIATRLALDSRKRRRLAVREIDEALDATTGSTPEISLERRELGRAIGDAAAKLPDEQRAAFVLAELHGLGIAEIAEALGVPENTAKTRLFRAREKMRAFLASEWRHQ
ncbi:MAG: sigma-70 family RNA polymerase sigma factor [Labilithrix sp.]|nr:sigma-70 family RNA polymerase sigma factor [Labilithrix sp.]MBX3221612.1 sigma-70 family RNA polymerase sigma factor [Labilithrix sp.]